VRYRPASGRQPSDDPFEEIWNGPWSIVIKHRFGALGKVRFMVQEPLYRTGVLTAIPVGSDKRIVFRRGVSEGCVLPETAMPLLDILQRFSTIESHHERGEGACEQVSDPLLQGTLNKLPAWLRGPLKPATQSAVFPITKLMQTLVDGKLLISDRELRESLTDSTEAPSKISCMTVVTRDRPQLLAQCLSGYFSNALAFGRKPRCVVIDDSSSAEMRDAVREAIRLVGSSYSNEIAYAGIEERKHFANAVSKAVGLRFDELDFALLGHPSASYTAGATRNASLLATSGDLSLNVDDDTICRINSAPGRDAALRLDSRDDFLEFWNFPSLDELSSSLPEIEADLLGLHEQYVGKKLSTCVREAGQQLEWGAESASSLLEQVLASRGRIGISFNGIAGDPGVYSPDYNLFLKNSARDRLHRSRRTYSNAFKQRCSLRAVQRPTVTHQPWCMTTAFALDNRQLIPPFMPAFESEDSIFGATLRRVDAEICAVHLPWAVLHRPAIPRSYPSDVLERHAGSIRGCDVIKALLARYVPQQSPIAPDCGLKSLGEHLTDIGMLSTVEFEEYVRYSLWDVHSRKLLLLEQTAKLYRNSPGYWARNVRQYQNRLEAAMFKPEYGIPLELAHLCAGEARLLVQESVLKLGRLFVAWPAIVDATRALRRAGHTIERPLT
jgi:hypothetical protein